MYQAETRGIRITVQPHFVEAESSPDEGRFLFAYTVEIQNLSLAPVQLKTRYWRIVDGSGRMKEVHGEGVVGRQPVLRPGQSFVYTSACPLTTPDGTMSGIYMMETADGEHFAAEIPAFSLDSPFSRRVLH